MRDNFIFSSNVGYKTDPDTAKVIIVVSGKGGAGKTVVSANLALALSMLGQKIALIDSDIGTRNLDIVLGYSDSIYHTIIDVIEGNASLNEAIIYDKDYPNLAFIPASQVHDKHALKPKSLSKIIEALKPEYDYIIIDAPAGIEQGLKNILPVADSAIVVVNPEKSSLLDSDRVIGILEDNGVVTNDMIINKYDVDLVKKGIMLDIKHIKEILSLNMLGIVPYDISVIESVNKGKPVVKTPNNTAGKAFYNIANRFLGKNVPLLYVFREGFFSKILGKIGF